MLKKTNTRTGRRWLKRIGFILGFVLFLILGLEVAWRYQWIDTYRRELTALNPEKSASKREKTILAMGDSFTAAQNSWVNALRYWHPEHRIINSAVPGTSILQANVMLKRRLSDFKPDLLIYQVYVGNDLFDLRYPLNWSESGMGRYFYWAMANRLRGIGWLNYALGQFKTAGNIAQYADNKVLESGFDPVKYNGRERLYFKAEPYLLSDQVMLTEARATDMEAYLSLLDDFLGEATKICPVLIVVVPHAAQTSSKRMSQLQTIGAKFREPSKMQDQLYPFFKRLKSKESEKVRVLNLLPDLQAAEANTRPAYYLHDPHLTDLGQQILAQNVDSLIRADYFNE